jgi:sugar lactone lactonase YvrE
MSRCECVWPAGATLGEGPLWSAREQALYWVDIKAPALHRWEPGSGARRSWSMPEPLGWIVERRDHPGFIAGFKSGIARLQLEPLSIEPLGNPHPESPHHRLNDAKADRLGRIWFGSMDDREHSDDGCFYRLDPDLRWHCVDEGYRVPNGPTFSADGRYLYHADSARRVVYRFDLGADGSLRNQTVFVRFPEAWGYPDGMSTDAEGGIWIAHWGAGRVSRFTPGGELDRFVRLPASQITSCAFAGPELERMFVTSAAIGLSDEPLAGGLFEVDPGVAGLPAQAFAG